MEFRIGELSSLLGISPESLRHYGQKSLLNPKKEQSGYRTFTNEDYFRLMVIKSLRGFDFSLNEIAEMMLEPTSDRRREMMEEKVREYDEQIARLVLLRRQAAGYAEALRTGAGAMLKCAVVDSPAMYSYNIFDSYYAFSKIPDLKVINNRWMDTAPFYHIFFEFTKAALRGRGKAREYRWGLALYAEDAERLGFAGEPYVKFWPSRRCVFTTFSVDEDGEMPLSALDYVFDFMAEAGLRLAGDALGQLLFQPFEKGRFSQYFELWVPVEDA